MIKINRIRDIVPGIHNLYAIPLYNIEKIIDNVIHIKNRDDYYNFELAEGSIHASYTPILSEEGEYYEITVGGFLPGESMNLTKKLNEIKNYKYIVIYQESDDTFRWAGTQEIGLQMKFQYNSGNDNNPKKGYDISFEMNMLNHPDPSRPFVRWYNPEISSDTEIPIGGGAIIDAVSEIGGGSFLDQYAEEIMDGGSFI